VADHIRSVAHAREILPVRLGPGRSSDTTAVRTRTLTVRQLHRPAAEEENRATLESGTEIAGYRVESVLGRGGMGTVYEAVQPFVLRKVALKLLEPALAADPDFRARFRREAEMQARIEHPHIVTVHEAGEAPQGLFIAMQLVRGPNLKELVRDGGLDPHRAVQILGQVAEALDTAHATGLIHRDIKPQNVLVGPGDHAYLADFGVTKAASDTGFTRTGQFLGTLDYVSPEQLDGRPASASSDLYALAALAYECLVGTVPFPKPTEAAVLYAHLSEDPPSAAAQRPDLPTAVDDVLRHGMAKTPDARPPTARAFVIELAAALGSATAAAPPVEPRPAAAPLRPSAPEDDGATDVHERPGAPTRSDLRRKASLPGMPRPRREGAPPAEPTDEPAAEQTAGPAAEATKAPLAPAATPPPEREPAPPEPEAEREAPAAVPAATAPTPAAERARPPRESASATTIRRRRRVAAGSTVAVLAAVGAIAGAATSGGGEAPAPAFSTVEAGDVSFAVPAAFRTQPGASAGVKLDDTAVAADADGDGSIAAGRSDAKGALLLPADLLARLSAKPKAGETVRLGAVDALRYRGLSTGDGARMTVYSAPTSRGVETIVCRQVADAVCDRAAASLRLAAGASATGVLPDADYAASVSKAVRDLGRRSRSARATLRQARSPGTQASSATALARAYGMAARALRKVQPGPREEPTHARLVAATAAAGDAWSDLARAARTDDDAGFAKARGALATAGRQIDRAQQALTDLGYRTS
jgi:serine/threonine protein kinase